MKLTRNKHLFFLIGVLLMLVVSGCEKRPEGLLSRTAMTNFLVDLHKLDGSLSASGLGSSSDRENVYYYNALLQKHAITKDQFDSSVVWYTAHPKSFEKIYVNVYDRLTQLDTEVKTGKYHPIDSALLRNSTHELWPLANHFIISGDSAVSQVSFRITDSQLRWNDAYILRFLQRLSISDSISSKRLVFRIHYYGGVCDSLSVPLASDSILRRYTLRLHARRQLPIENISGELLNDTSKTAKFFVQIDSITLTRRFDALAQDSIKTLVEIIQQELAIDSIATVDSKKPIGFVYPFDSLRPNVPKVRVDFVTQVDTLMPIDTVITKPLMPLKKIEGKRKVSKIQLLDETSK